MNDLRSATKLMTILKPDSLAVLADKIAVLSYSYTMGCLPVRGDNPRALASGLSYVQMDKHLRTIYTT